MNILILDSGNAFNYGSMMMAENFIYYSEKITKEKNNYYIETNDLKNVERIKQATGIENIFMVGVKDLFEIKRLRYAILFNSLKIKDIKSELLKKMDKIFFLGGDDFTQVYGKKQLIQCLLLVNLIKDKNNYVALVGQSIGPFDKWIEMLAIKIFKRMDLISLRDPESFNYLKLKGLSNIESVTDLALLPLAKEPICGKEAKYVLFCPSEIIYKYAKRVDRNKFVELNKKMCEFILDKIQLIELILLPHVTDDRTGGDIKMLKEIYDSIDDKFKNRIIKIESNMLPYEVRKIIKKSLFVVAERMHPAISALECEVPSVIFSYGRKYKGIFEELYGLKETVFEIRKFNDYEIMWNELKKIIDYVIRNNTQLREKIRNKNLYTQSIAMKHLEKLNERRS
jgi:polysaccharide pyruvyl transferase WcaK-like protein